jgi:hypothetical protein
MTNYNLFSSLIELAATRSGYVKPESLVKAIDDPNEYMNAPRTIRADVEAVQTTEYRYVFEDPEKVQKAISIVAWIYSNISLIARNTWSAEFSITKLGKAGKPIKVPDHDFIKVFNNPNEWMTKAYLIEFMMRWLLTSERGAFVFLAPDSSTGELREMWPISSNQIVPIRHRTKFVKKFMYYPLDKSVKPFTIDGRYIMWLRYANPYDLWKSLPPFLSAIRPAQLEIGIEESQSKLYNESRGLPMTIVSLDADLSPADFEVARNQIRMDWEQKGSTVAVTRAGQISTQSLGFTQRDLETMIAQDMNRDKIDSIFFGFPIRSKAFSSGEGLEVMDKIVKEQTYWPMFIMLRDNIQAQIINRFYPDDNVNAQFADPRTFDRALNIQEMMITSRWKTVNEMREQEGEVPLEDPKDMPGLGDMLVQHAVNSSFVATYFGLEQDVGKDPDLPEVGNLNDFTDPEMLTNRLAREGSEAPGDGLNPSMKAYTEGIKAEMKRWRTVARRSMRQHGDALERKFETDVIPMETQKAISSLLLLATSMDEVDEAFQEWV